jgi:ParB family chromosome partitioning protein
MASNLIRNLPLDQVYANPNQPRKLFEQNALDELAQSIRVNGLIQPITVRPDGDGKFMIVCGERRYRAHQRAGLATIKAFVADLSDDQLAINAIIENLQRADITPMEEARAYAEQIANGYTPETLAAKLGMKKNAFRIKWRLSLLALRPEYQKLFEADQLNSTQALEMAALSLEGQDKLFKLIKAGGLDNPGRLKAAARGIKEAESQTAMFADDAPVDPADVRKIDKLERAVEAMMAVLGEGFKDNELRAARRADPVKADTLADKIKLAQKYLGLMEKDLRRMAAQAA